MGGITMAKLVVGKNKKVGIPAVIRGSDQQKEMLPSSIQLFSI